MRRTALALAVVAIATFATTTPAGAAASITVRPSTHLFDGESIRVKGNGFDPHVNLVAVECKAGPDAISFCDESTAKFTQTGNTGAYALDFIVRHTIVTGFGSVDCSAGAGACVIAVADAGDIVGTAVLAPISFAAAGPPQRGVLSVPMSVASGGVAVVHATGFAPYAMLEVSLCAADPGNAGDCASPDPKFADDTGATDYALSANPTIHTKHARSIDCTVVGACVYGAWDSRDFARTLATAPYVIAPKPAGALGVEPATDLHDGDTVEVSGSRWPADKVIKLYECNGLSAGAACNNRSSVVTRSDGFFSTSYTVRAASTDRDGTVNCNTGQCWIIAIYTLHGIPVFAAYAVAFVDPTTTPVTSHYSSAELAIVDEAARVLRVSKGEEQHLGAWALAWVLDLTGTGIITPAPDEGPASVITDWLPAEYSAISAVAADHGTRLAEFQKTGALFLAYELSIS